MNKKLKSAVLIMGFLSIYGAAYFLATVSFEQVLLFGKIPILALLFLFAFILTSLLITFLSHRKSSQDFKISLIKTVKVLFFIIFMATLSWATSNYILQPSQLPNTVYEQVFFHITDFFIGLCADANL